MTAPESFFAKIEEGKTVRLDLPLGGGKERTRVYGVFRPGEGPYFQLVFPLGALPQDRIDLERDCFVCIDNGGCHVSVRAMVKAIVDAQTLNMQAMEVMSHEQQRNYFRVDVQTPIIAASLVPEELADGREKWRLSGETLDVSGSGLLADFPGALEPGQYVQVHLVLPTADRRVVHAVARVIRSCQVRRRCHRIALHFEQIEPQDRDQIMACCFQVQRQQLRLKVQIAGN